jgi:hypothetical protein
VSSKVKEVVSRQVNVLVSVEDNAVTFKYVYVVEVNMVALNEVNIFVPSNIDVVI